MTPAKYRDNFLRAVEFRYPDWIPCSVDIAPPVWRKYRERLEEVVLKYKSIFPWFKKGSVNYDWVGHRVKGTIFVDDWGCVWAFGEDGLQGQVVKHPLSDWSKLKELKVPDPDKGVCVEGGPTIPWEEIEESVEKTRREGGLVVIGLSHGFFFQRLYYLRGFTNLMKDFITKPPQLYELIKIVEDYYMELVKRAVKLKPDIITFGDDLGCQDRMPISPKTFREFIYPTYRKLFTYIRSHGIHVRLHSDGHVVEVLDQLVETGLSIINIQDRVNGINNIKRICKGRVCVDLDIDRQYLLPRGTPSEIREHIRNAIIELGSRRGGLMFTAGVYQDVPLENIDALCRALEELRTLHKTLPY